MFIIQGNILVNVPVNYDTMLKSVSHTTMLVLVVN